MSEKTKLLYKKTIVPFLWVVSVVLFFIGGYYLTDTTATVESLKSDNQRLRGQLDIQGRAYLTIKRQFDYESNIERKVEYIIDRGIEITKDQAAIHRKDQVLLDSLRTIQASDAGNYEKLRSINQALAEYYDLEIIDLE